MGDVSFSDMMIGATERPLWCRPQWASRQKTLPPRTRITREQQDAFAVESQRRAAAAVEAGYFENQILPIEVKVRREMVPFATDEHIKAGTTMESLGKASPGLQEGRFGDGRKRFGHQ